MTELVLALHLAIILFFILGFPVGLAINHRMFRIVHAAGLAAVTGLMASGIPCPLTVWEEILSGGSYEGSFIAAWLKKIIYLEWFKPVHVLIADLIFAALVFSSFFWWPLKPRKDREGVLPS